MIRTNIFHTFTINHAPFFPSKEKNDKKVKLFVITLPRNDNASAITKLTRRRELIISFWGFWHILYVLDFSHNQFNMC